MTRMSRTMIALFCCIALVACVAGCGGNELQYIVVSPSGATNLTTVGGTQPYSVTAHFSNTSHSDVTTHATYTLTPPTAPVGSATYSVPTGAVTVNAGGIVTEALAACTWTSTTVGLVTTKTTNPYTLTVTYAGFTGTATISVSSTNGCPVGP